MANVQSRMIMGSALILVVLSQNSTQAMRPYQFEKKLEKKVTTLHSAFITKQAFDQHKQKSDAHKKDTEREHAALRHELEGLHNHSQCTTASIGLGLLSPILHLHGIPCAPHCLLGSAACLQLASHYLKYKNQLQAQEIRQGAVPDILEMA